jgi:hypothetical protein
MPKLFYRNAFHMTQPTSDGAISSRRYILPLATFLINDTDTCFCGPRGNACSLDVTFSAELAYVRLNNIQNFGPPLMH